MMITKKTFSLFVLVITFLLATRPCDVRAQSKVKKAKPTVLVKPIVEVKSNNEVKLDDEVKSNDVAKSNNEVKSPPSSDANVQLNLGETKPDTLYPISILVTDKRFVYQLITQEYITNENDYFLDIKLDTCYLIFTAIEGDRLFRLNYCADEYGGRPWSKANGLQLLPFDIRFSSRGAIEELTNWKAHRDLLVSSLSAQVQAKLISSENFDIERMKLNNEKIVRRLAMEDLVYLFDLSNDSIREDGEYIRIKPVRSPFSGEDIYLQGNLITERLAGTKNSVKFHTKNTAGVHEKPILLAECNEYALAASDGTQPISEIQRVGLNNEVDYQYNLKQQVMSRVIFSDVLAINFQSRGNIRTYSLWDRK